MAIWRAESSGMVQHGGIVSQHLERLDLLAPWLYAPVLRFIQQAHKLGVQLCVVHTWRSVQEQTLIYQKGRTYDRANGIWVVSDEKAVVTKAKPGTSAHNVVDQAGKPASVAVDVMPLRNGQIEWIEGFAFWQPIYDLAWKCGLDPLGDTVGAYLPGDWGHFEEPGWKLKLSGYGLVLPTADVVGI